MRLLVVGFAGSVHIARYLALLDDLGWDLHLFDSSPYHDNHPEPHPELPAVTLHLNGPWTPPPGTQAIAAATGPAVTTKRARAARLAAVIDEVAPDVVHSHEIQHGARLVDIVRWERGTLPAPWLVTNWGSDIYWFGRAPRHVPLLRSVLAHCDYYGAECHRDVALARAFGLRGQVVGVWPVAGGIDREHAATLRAPGPPSARRAIALKGVSSIWGGAELGLAAIERSGDLLDGWELCGYQMEPAVAAAAKALAARLGMRYTQLSSLTARDAPHDALLAMHGRARTSIGLNRSDALSTSFLEAMAMGSLPVQSTSSCGYELAPPGRGALFAAPDDADGIAAALRRALTDDDLVDTAAARNEAAAAEHLDRRRTRARAADAYERIVSDRALAA